MGYFTSSTVGYYQKSKIFAFLNLFTNIPGYFNLWDIFRFMFIQIRMTFFHKHVVAEKYNFSSNAYHNFAKSKVISNVKMLL